VRKSLSQVGIFEAIRNEKKIDLLEGVTAGLRAAEINCGKELAPFKNLQNGG
jgi:hypothetical protein